MSEFQMINGSPCGHIGLRRSPFLVMRTDWLARAAMLPGRTLHYAVAAFALATIADSPTIAPGPKTLARYGVSSDASGDALTRLIQAGLVSADRKRGRAPRITLLEGPGKVLALRKSMAGGT